MQPQLTLLSCCGAAQLLERLHCLCSISLHNRLSADNDLRWLWGPCTVIMCSNSLGNCDNMLSLTTGTGPCTPTIYIVCMQVSCFAVGCSHHVNSSKILAVRKRCSETHGRYTGQLYEAFDRLQPPRPLHNTVLRPTWRQHTRPGLSKGQNSWPLKQQ